MWINFLQAGAWTQKKHNIYLKFSSSFLHTGNEFDHLGNQKAILEDFKTTFDNAVYQESRFSVYLEYGLLQNFDIIVDLPFKLSNSKRTEHSNYFGERDASFTTIGLSDLRLLGKWQLFEKGLVFSLQPGVKIPLGYQTSDISGPKLGTGGVDYEIQLLAGKSLYPISIYFTGGVGYRFRNDPLNALHNEYFANLEIGHPFTWGLLRIGGEIIKNTETPGDIYGQTITLPLPAGGGAIPDRVFGDQNFSKINMGIMYRLGKRFAVDGSVYHTLAGQNIITGTTWVAGIVFQ